MSSEAAFFLNPSATKAEVRESVSRESEIPSELLEQAQSSILLPERSSEARTEASEVADEKLLEQVSGGSSEALGILFHRHARAVRDVAFRILRNEAEADDLVQEVFLFLFRKAALFDRERGTARSWLFQVVYHRAFDRRRHLNTRHFYASEELEEGTLRPAGAKEKSSFHEVSIDDILGKQLTAKFNEILTPEQRETIQLFFFEGLTFREIAQLTGRSLAKVRTNHYRGLDRLRKIVHPENQRSK
jgi:RNA polymerase sigma-70 factor (ECF subfamily)